MSCVFLFCTEKKVEARTEGQQQGKKGKDQKCGTCVFYEHTWCIGCCFKTALDTFDWWEISINNLLGKTSLITTTNTGWKSDFCNSEQAKSEKAKHEFLWCSLQIFFSGFSLSHPFRTFPFSSLSLLKVKRS